jgi:hypothetical protein
VAFSYVTGTFSGDKSRVVDIERPGPEFPLFTAATRYTAELEPGDVLFIPAFWFHNMKVLYLYVSLSFSSALFRNRKFCVLIL